MPIKISYTEPLTAFQDELLEKVHKMFKEQNEPLEEYDESGIHPPLVKRPKK